MKKLLLLLCILLSSIFTYSQCTPDPQYQNSQYGIWPDTIQNLPIVNQGVNYYAELTVKTPSTLIEAAGGDSSMTVIDTVVMGISVSEYVGHWPVDSMVLVQINGLPNGFNLGCNEPGCMLLGDDLTCAYVSGFTNDPVGVYPIELAVNVYTHGTIDLGIIQYPISIDLYSALGDYEYIKGYKLIISDGTGTGIDVIDSDNLELFQNVPNPTSGETEIRFYTPIPQDIRFAISDIFGRLIYTEDIFSNLGINTMKFSGNIPRGVYTYSIQNDDNIISKRMIITQ